MFSSPAGSSLRRNDARLFLVVVLCVFLLRLPFILVSPAVTPDGQTYQTVADNIRENGCVSVSDPGERECVPHWGGNQSPFYPSFIAFVNALGGETVPMALLLQALIYALAAAYVAIVVDRGTGGPAAGIAVAVVLAVSPVQVAWPRFLLTETLALAATLLVFAECLRSIEERRLRVVSIAAALVFAVLARYDSILLAIPVAVTGFIAERPFRAVTKGLVIALIVAAPVAAWTARNVGHGLSAMPNTFMKSGEPTPWGLLLWADTWVTDLYVAQFSYGIANRDYARGRAVIDLGLFETEEERRRVDDLFEELVRHQGKAFPRHVDQGFLELAEWRRARYPLETWVVIPLKRAYFLWANPIHSFAWPVELDAVLSTEDRLLWANGGVAGKLEVALRYPIQALVKAGVTAYRYLLTALALVVLLIIVVRPWTSAYFGIALGAGYAASRVVIIGFQSSLDSRYAVEGYALLEVGMAIAVVSLYQERVRRRIRTVSAV